MRYVYPQLAIAVPPPSELAPPPPTENVDTLHDPVHKRADKSIFINSNNLAWH